MDNLLNQLLQTATVNRLKNTQLQNQVKQSSDTAQVLRYDANSGSYVVNVDGNVILAQGINSKASSVLNARVDGANAWVDGL